MHLILSPLKIGSNIVVDSVGIVEAQKKKVSHTGISWVRSSTDWTPCYFLKNSKAFLAWLRVQPPLTQIANRKCGGLTVTDFFLILFLFWLRIEDLKSEIETSFTF